jgi:hypothetical protein
MIARKMNLFGALNSYVGEFSDFSDTRKIEFKLLSACLNNLNYALKVCEDMPGLLANGSAMQQYSDQHGRRVSREFPIVEGFSFSTPTAIFADPHSEFYCIQSLFVDVLVPEPRPYHSYPQYDIRQILKLRIDQNTYLCNTLFPDFFTPLDVADRMSNQIVPRNMSHPIIRTYSTIINLTMTNVNNSHMSISTAAAEIDNVLIKNQSAGFSFSREVILANLQEIRQIYVQIATEPARMKFAETLDGLPYMARFNLVGRKSLDEISELFEMIYNKTTSTATLCNDTLKVHRKRINYHDILFPPVTLEDLPVSEVNILDYLINGINLNVSHALALTLSFNPVFLAEISLKDCSVTTAKYMMSKITKYGMDASLEFNPVYKKCLGYTDSIRENLDNYIFSDDTHRRIHENNIDMAIQMLLFTVCLSLLFCLATRSRIVPKALNYCQHRLFGSRKPQHKHHNSELEEARPLVTSSSRHDTRRGRGTFRSVRPVLANLAEHKSRWGLR